MSIGYVGDMGKACTADAKSTCVLGAFYIVPGFGDIMKVAEKWGFDMPTLIGGAIIFTAEALRWVTGENATKPVRELG